MWPRPGCDQSSGTDNVLHWIDPHWCHTTDPVRAGGAELAHAETLATSATTSSDTDAPLTALGARCTREGYARDAPPPTRSLPLCFA
jgi:hypothetical protein